MDAVHWEINEIISQSITHLIGLYYKCSDKPYFLLLATVPTPLRLKVNIVKIQFRRYY